MGATFTIELPAKLKEQNGTKEKKIAGPLLREL